MKTETVKGFQDFVGEEALKRAEIQKDLIEIFENYGFQPAETPVVEYEEFVKGENVSDEAVSDIFKLQDRGKRKLALRYEFTFQLKRIMKNQKLPFKRYQIGPVFRDEPVTANRFRQFTQCDIDTIGIPDGQESRYVSEILALATEILAKLDIKPTILVNNRKLMNEILKTEKINKKYFDDVLREIDKFGKISETELKKNLKKFKAEKIIDKMKLGEEFFNQFESYKEIISLMEYCRAYGFEVKFSPTIVRGLSYYNGIVFEIKAKGTKDTITAGGSYKFKDTQCTGISFGLERISNLTSLQPRKKGILIISLDQDRQAIKVAQKLRQSGYSVSIYYGKPSKALAYANAYGFKGAIFVGAEEVKKKKYKTKNLKTGEEKTLTLETKNKKNIVLKL